MVMQTKYLPMVIVGYVPNVKCILDREQYKECIYIEVRNWTGNTIPTLRRCMIMRKHRGTKIGQQCIAISKPHFYGQNNPQLPEAQ